MIYVDFMSHVIIQERKFIQGWPQSYRSRTHPSNTRRWKVSSRSSLPASCRKAMGTEQLTWPTISVTLSYPDVRGLTWIRCLCVCMYVCNAYVPKAWFQSSQRWTKAQCWLFSPICSTNLLIVSIVDCSMFSSMFQCLPLMSGIFFCRCSMFSLN